MMALVSLLFSKQFIFIALIGGIAYTVYVVYQQRKQLAILNQQLQVCSHEESKLKGAVESLQAQLNTFKTEVSAHIRQVLQDRREAQQQRDRAAAATTIYSLPFLAEAITQNEQEDDEEYLDENEEEDEDEEEMTDEQVEELVEEAKALGCYNEDNNDTTATATATATATDAEEKKTNPSVPSPPPPPPLDLQQMFSSLASSPLLSTLVQSMSGLNNVGGNNNSNKKE